MTTASTNIDLTRVDWSAAIQAARERRVSGVSVAEIESLSALFTGDPATALARLQRANQAEPFQPLHRLRIALTLARFGETDKANEVLDELSARLPPTPVIDYLRALFVVQSGVLDRARGLSGALETSHPKFVQGRFLRAEVQVLAGKPSTTEKFLSTLPLGAEWESSWTDLLVKLVLLNPREGLPIAEKYLAKSLGKDTIGRALVERALSWVRASMQELAAQLVETAADSRTEELLLAIMLETLTAEADLSSALQTLRELGYESSKRPGMRRIYDSVLTRQAADLAGKRDYEGALRLVEQSLSRQPYDPVHHQNRAALFTLMREAGPYAEAWADMNAHQYRLILLGTFDASTLMQIVKTHRLFASQARGGIFRTVKGESGERPRLVTNGDQIAADPELLRQWIHHTRAALVLQHLALAPDAQQVLLNPEDRDQAFERATGLTFLSRSLGVLVTEEGGLLGTRLHAFWQGLAEEVPARYDLREFAPPTQSGADPEAKDEDGAAPGHGARKSKVEDLYLEHLNVLAELFLICLQWSPGAGHLETAEEILQWIATECAFLDETILQAKVSASGYETPYPLVVLSGRLSSARAESHSRLTSAGQRAVVETGMAELLRSMAWAAYGAFKGNAKDSTLHSMPYMDRARRLDPESAEIELSAAQLLEYGGFSDEAHRALERFQHIAESPTERQREIAEKLAEIFRQHRKDGKTGEKRVRDSLSEEDARGYETRAERVRRIAELEQELELAPAVLSLYSELVKEFAAAGRFDDAVAYADRSVSQCLGRADQMNARSLAIEARGFQALATDDIQSARLAAVGVHEPARRALEAKAARIPLTYAELYLLGRCKLSAGVPADAQQNFQKAAELCTRPLHRTVLRSLAADVDGAYREFARAAVNEALTDGLASQALEQAALIFAQLENPAAWLLDFARVCYTVALDRVNAEAASNLPAITLKTSWAPRFQQALAAPTDGKRALALALLAAELHPPSARAAQLLVDRAHRLNDRLEAAGILSRAGALLRGKRFDAALAALESTDLAIASEPRLQRMRALALLGLQRFREADEIVMTLSEVQATAGTDIEQFVRSYPELVFRQKLAAALDHLRADRASAAAQILDVSIPANEQQTAELAYCQAFRHALEGFERKRKGALADARARFLQGMRLLEPLLPSGVLGSGAHVTELYDRMEKELDTHGPR